MTLDSGTENSWHQLYAKSDKMRVPERTVLTKNTVYGTKRPEPEIVEHMLDDLENKMRNYFVLYNRERDLRQKADENCYRLEKEIVNYQHRLESYADKLNCLENKIKSMVEQPLKLKDTIDKIDLLYTQMDTLIQAFVGIGSCAVIQGYSRIAFIKLCLEYLYPCRELDVRLNSLYTALYSVLVQYGGIESTFNEVMKPQMVYNEDKVVPLTGFNIRVHRLLLKCDLPSPEPTFYVCKFRYDHQEMDTVKDCYTVKANVKPLDNAAKVIEFDLVIGVDVLPPKVPNIIPKLLIDVYANDFYIGTAESSIISHKTLRPIEPWTIVDSNGFHCGDAIITVLPTPTGARLPATNFKEEVVKVKNDVVSPPKDVLEPKVEELKVDESKSSGRSTTPAKDTAAPTTTSPNKSGPFEPKKTNFRRPLLFNKAVPSGPPPASVVTKKPVEPKVEPSRGSVTKLAERFMKKGGDNGSSSTPEATPAVPLAESTPPEVTTTVPLAVEASPNYLSLKSRATPRDRGEVEGGAKDVLDVTSGGLPVADLREAEGELNKGDTTAVEPKVLPSTENTTTEDDKEADKTSITLPAGEPCELKEEVNNEADVKTEETNNKSSTEMPTVDFREAEGQLNREASTASGKTTSGDEWKDKTVTSGGTATGKEVETPSGNTTVVTPNQKDKIDEKEQENLNTKPSFKDRIIRKLSKRFKDDPEPKQEASNESVLSPKKPSIPSPTPKDSSLPPKTTTTPPVVPKDTSPKPNTVTPTPASTATSLSPPKAPSINLVPKAKLPTVVPVLTPSEDLKPKTKMPQVTPKADVNVPKKEVPQEPKPEAPAKNTLQDKPLVPIVIAPKLLKKPPPPKK